MEQLIQRFRANLVISGQEPFAEDDWSHLTVGGAQFQVGKNMSWTHNWQEIKLMFRSFLILCWRWWADVAVVRWLELIKNQPLGPRNPLGRFLIAEVEKSVKTKFLILISCLW